MSLLDGDMFVQSAVYWAPAKPDSNGQPTFASPVAVACRWDAASVNALEKGSEVVHGPAKVYVASDVLVRGWLWIGALTGAPADPRAAAGAQEILRFEKDPDIRGEEFLRTALLKSGG